MAQKNLCNDATVTPTSNFSTIKEVALKDIIVTQAGYMHHVDVIVENFLNSIDRKVTKRQKENITKLAKAFLLDLNITTPLLCNLEMGEGKSKLLLEFVKYMCSVDKNFSCIVVKRTRKEAQEFAIELGLDESKLSDEMKAYASSNLASKDEINEFYYSNSIPFPTESTDNTKQSEEFFIARVLRGFNKDDCMKKNAHLSFGKLADSFKEYEYSGEYSPDICLLCEIFHCPVRKAQQEQSKHRVIVITHSRLFLSNYVSKLMEDIKFCDDLKSTKMQRKFLFIDEKIDTVDLGYFSLNDWNVVAGRILGKKPSVTNKKVIEDVTSYFKNLQYPDNHYDAPIKVGSLDNDFLFDKQIKAIVDDDIDNTKTLICAEKFIKFGGTTSRDWKKNLESLTFNRHINFNEYLQSGNFLKVMILDATGRDDLDYSKSDLYVLSDLNKNAKHQIDLHINTTVSLSKSKLIFDGNETNKKKTNQENYMHKVNLIALDVKDVILKVTGKTLIICYKEISDMFNYIYKFKNDLINALVDVALDTNLYEVNHFGATTTGVNLYRNFENIIILGTLHKGFSYYLNKGKIMDLPESTIQINEYSIDAIQQIGRICIREGRKANVFIMGADENVVLKLQNYFSAKVNHWQLRHFTFEHQSTIKSKNKTWSKIIEVLKCKLVNTGDTITLAEITCLITDKRPDTLAKALQHSNVQEFINTNGISFDKKSKTFLKD